MSKQVSRAKVIDLVVVSVIQALALYVMWQFNVNFLYSALIVFGIPAAYLVWRQAQHRVKILVASLAIGVLGGFVFAFVPELNGAWAYGEGIVLPKILGVVPLDELIWSFAWCAFIIAFYEHFIDRSKSHTPLAKGALLLLFLVCGLVVLNVALFSFAPTLLDVPFAYLTVTSVVTVVFVVAASLRPHIVLRALPMALYFTVANLVYEVVSLYNGHWFFPGEYIGWVSMAGVSLPVEEFVFFVLLFSIVLAVLYELFFDNQKN